MKGWILYKQRPGFLTPQSYGIKRLLEYAKENGIDLDYVQPEEIEFGDRKNIFLRGSSAQLPDFIIPRMGSLTFDFDLEIIRSLEKLAITCLNSSQSIEIAKDKFRSIEMLAENNLPTPNTKLLEFPIDLELVEKNFGFPVVVKTLSGSGGSGVYLCETKKDFKDLMETVPQTNIIVQEFIKSSKGRDLRVFTIGGRAVACVERIAPEDDFRANFSQGGTARPHPITPEIERLAVETSKIFDLDIAGIDLLFDGDHFKICEANSAPGFESIESCTDLNIPQEIFDFIKIRPNL